MLKYGNTDKPVIIKQLKRRLNENKLQLPQVMKMKTCMFLMTLFTVGTRVSQTRIVCRRLTEYNLHQPRTNFVGQRFEDIKTQELSWWQRRTEWQDWQKGHIIGSFI